MTLYINTSDQYRVVVALKKDSQTIDELADHNKFGSQILLPMIQKLLKQQNLEFNDLTDVEVDTGPGSFTGLRVGAAVAQAIAYGTNIPLNGQIGQNLELNYT